MGVLLKNIKEAKIIALTGHVRPDGDCSGACLALYTYIKKYYKDIKVKLFLEIPPDKFSYLPNYEEITDKADSSFMPDLCISLDASDKERLGDNVSIFEKAAKTICIDHHVTNTHFADIVILDADASSTCEVLFRELDTDLIDKDIATCLYTGIVHDTGVFKYPCTGRKTMEAVGKLIERGVEITRIIDESFYARTYEQNKLLGKVLSNSKLLLGGKLIYGYVSLFDVSQAGLSLKDLDGIIDQLRNTKGTEVALFIYETAPKEYKISLRSNSYVNVSEVASLFGGGGHIRAAGASISGELDHIIKDIISKIEERM